jgi:D-beta-D-heptose 7-phosphate kinase/D-beta-D-heptose 1-phosphate adenosyltransferase
MDLSKLQSLLDSVKGSRVTCIGDVMVDRFVYGDVHRTSPEAPVPVLALGREESMLGGAGNVARNVAALGGEVALVGVCGNDAAGHEAIDMCGQADIEAHLVADGQRPTTVKTRFVASGQQLLRVDSENCQTVARETEQKLITAIRHAVSGSGAILLSDYGKGAVTAGVIEAVQEAAQQAGAKLIVDSKARSFAKYGAVDLVKPNALELAAATELPTDTDEEVEIALAHALALSRAKAILVTRAAKGMSLAVRGGDITHFPGVPREVFDVSGAGDTALAALGLAISAKADIRDCVRLALLASGIVVQKAGTATASPQELLEAEWSVHLAPIEAKIASRSGMVERISRWRAQGLKVGFTNGCFDILHRGHIGYLGQARSWCDRLIVAINTDESVAALKGPSRPVNDLDSRALVLAGLASVDLVVPFGESTPIDLILSARPDVLIKGADYVEEAIVGASEVRGWGGDVRRADIVEGYSTTNAIARMIEGQT